MKTEVNLYTNNISATQTTSDRNSLVSNILSNSSNNNKLNDNVDIKTVRENKIREIADKYKITVNDLYDFINNAFGYSKDEVYKLDEKIFNVIADRTITAVFNIINSKQSNLSVNERLSKFAKNINNMLQNGNTIEEATNFLQNFKENGLFQILKIQFPSELKQYNSAKDVPQSVLENCLHKFFEHYKKFEKTNDNKNIGKSLAIYKNLLSRTSADDYKVLFNAFIKVASQEDEKLSGLLSMIENFKDKPESFQKFINNDLQEICAKKGLDYDKVKPVINKIAEVARSNGIDSIEFMQKLIELFDLNALYEKLKKIDEKDLNENQRAFITNYEKYTALKNLDQNDLNDDDKAFLKEFENKIISIKEGIAAAIAAHNTEDAQKILNQAREVYGLSLDNVINKLADIVHEYNIDIDQSYFDEITNGKFSECYNNLSNEKSSDNVNNSGFGFSQSCSPENYWSALARKQEYVISINVANKSTEPQYVVLPNKTKSVEIITPWKKYQTIKSLSAKELYDGLAGNYIKIDDILDNYKDLSHSSKLFVNKLIEIMSPGEQNFRLDGMPNRAAIDIIKHSNINPEDLKLALDYATRKELEKLEENRANN